MGYNVEGVTWQRIPVYKDVVLVIHMALVILRDSTGQGRDSVLIFTLFVRQRYHDCAVLIIHSSPGKYISLLLGGKMVLQ
jgi:hypothetical protein